MFEAERPGAMASRVDFRYAQGSTPFLFAAAMSEAMRPPAAVPAS